MTKFVGAEYLIACILIEKGKKGYNSVSLADLATYGIYVQRLSLRQKIDAVFLTSKAQFFNAIYDFSDYFDCEFDADEQIKEIRINKTKNIADLSYRFMGYLPKDIFDFLTKAVEQYAA